MAVVYAMTEGRDDKFDNNSGAIAVEGDFIAVYSSMEEAKVGYRRTERSLKWRSHTIRLEVALLKAMEYLAVQVGKILLLDPHHDGRGISYKKGRYESCLVF